MMQSFGDWDLTSAQIDFEIESHSFAANELLCDEFGSQLIIAVLEGMGRWTGYHFTQLIIVIINIYERKFVDLTIASLQFTGHLCRHTEFKMLEEMRAALLSCRTIKSVAITGFLVHPFFIQERGMKNVKISEFLFC